MAFDPDKQSRDALNRGAGAYSTPGVDAPFKPTEFVPQSSRPQVHFKTHDVDPPSPLYVRQEDGLGVIIINSDPACTFVRVRFRLLRASDGVVIATQQDLPITSNSIANNFQLSLVEGYLLSIQCLGQVNTKRGRCFVAVNLSAQQSGTPASFLLISDYLSILHQATWPGGEFIAAVESNGWSQSLQVGNPAAGADWSVSVPTNQRWRIESLVATLVTAVAVANRVPTFIIDDGVNILFQVDAIAAEVASTTKVYALAAGQTAATGAGNTISLPLPGPQFLTTGWRVRSSTAAIQAADQWSGISLNVETWVDT